MKSNLVLAALILSALPAQARASSDGGPDVARNPSPVDTSKVRVGASVTIVYGLGFRDPLSGPDPVSPTLVPEPSEVDTVDTRRRIVLKFLAGGVGGILSGMAVPIGLAALEVDGYTAVGMWPVGLAAGAALGVSITDPHDQLISALGGSVAGLLLGGSILYASDNPWALILGPPVLSTLASEMWREESEGIRLSAGLSPGLRSVSAVARVHF